jgi:lactate permease
MVWQQIYDPFGNPVISTLLAAVPVVVMLAALAFFHVKAHLAALLALASALVIAIFAFGMPANMAGSAAHCMARPTACCRLAGSFSTSSFCTA